MKRSFAPRSAKACEACLLAQEKCEMGHPKDLRNDVTEEVGKDDAPCHRCARLGINCKILISDRPVGSITEGINSGEDKFIDVPSSARDGPRDSATGSNPGDPSLGPLLPPHHEKRTLTKCAGCQRSYKECEEGAYVTNHCCERLRLACSRAGEEARHEEGVNILTAQTTILADAEEHSRAAMPLVTEVHDLESLSSDTRILASKNDVCGEHLRRWFLRTQEEDEGNAHAVPHQISTTVIHATFKSGNRVVSLS